MKAPRKFAVVIAAVAVVFGAVVAVRVYRTKADARNLERDLIDARARAARGDARAQYKLGSFYFHGRGVANDFAEALRWYRKAADQGDPRAEYAIGYMYDTGAGVQQDFAQAFAWYQKAASQGDPHAECGLGAMYYDGRAVKRDWAQAALWYRRAAESGLPRGEYDLGYMYEHGQGVPQDKAKAAQWFRRAAEHGDEYARRAFRMRLTPFLSVVLALQALGGAWLLLDGFPLSLNIWEPNQRPRSTRDWISTAIGFLCLFAAGLSWYGYKHNLIWCWVYGFTGFMLFKWALNGTIFGLLVAWVLRNKKAGPSQSETPIEEL